MLQQLMLASVIGVAAFTASADIPASLQVDPGSTSVVTLEITITGNGSETQSDSRVVPLLGKGATRFTPNYEPFDGMILDSLVLRPGDCQLGYEFFCNPLYGCIPITVTLSNISVTLQGPAGASIVGQSIGWGATWRLQGTYSLTSPIFNSAGSIDALATPGFNGRIAVGNGGWRLDQMLLGAIEFDVPASNLPAGLAVHTRTSLGLGGAALAGNYVPPPPASCGSSGRCNELHATPGCDLVNCCDQVCDVDPACCIITWDQTCVQLAVANCVIPPINDLCSAPTPLPLGRFPFTTVNANTDGDRLPSSCFDLGTAGAFVNDVWFTHTANANNGVLVSTCGHAAFDTRIAVYTGCGGSLIACSDDAANCPGGTSRLGFYGVAGQTYLIRVGGKYGQGTGEIDIAWGDIDPPQTSITAAWPGASGGNGHFYALYSVGSDGSWDGAIAKAASLGGHAATVNSAAETSFILRYARPPAVYGATAIGLIQQPVALEPAGGWGWITGEPLNYTNWNIGEPNDANALGEDVGMMNIEGTWNDINSGVAHVLIEWDANPRVADVTWTSADGGDGSRYRAVLAPFALTWSQAAAAANAAGGRLVSLETPAEAQFVYQRLAAFTSMWSMTPFNGGPWVGLHRQKGVWKWESGAALSWSPWQPGEPNGTGDFASYYSYQQGPSNGFDDTFDGDQRRAYIIEFPANPADLDHDGTVGAPDLALLLGSWGRCLGTPCIGDINQNGSVNATDLALLLAAWGQ